MVDLCGLELSGISIGGIRTCLELPSWRLAFDMGEQSERALSCETVLFTHAHIDHMGAAPWHAAMRALRGMSPPTYVVPKGDVDAFHGLLDAWRTLDRGELPCTVVGLAPGEEHPLGRGLVARPFRSPHRITCQGYAIWSSRNVLRLEFRDLPSPEIRRLRVKEGLKVTEAVELCELAFTGDTLIDVVDREECVRTARRLLIEATFLDERVGVTRAREMGHVHLDEIAARATLFENEIIVLTHFSARYSATEVMRALDRRLPPDLRRRVVPLVRGLRG
jgi:ribonuclease Z